MLVRYWMVLTIALLVFLTGLKIYLYYSNFSTPQNFWQNVVENTKKPLSSITRWFGDLKNSIVTKIVKRENNNNNMACASCAQKQQYAGMQYAKSNRNLVVPEDVDCHFTKEELEEKKVSLTAQKIGAPPSRLTKITYGLSIINRTLKVYDTNCNKYLKDLYAVFSR